MHLKIMYYVSHLLFAWVFAVEILYDLHVRVF